MARVAFIGLGNMGMPMARRLVESGHTVRGFDANATALEVLASHGGVAGGDVTEVADCAVGEPGWPLQVPASAEIVLEGHIPVAAPGYTGTSEAGVPRSAR